MSAVPRVGPARIVPLRADDAIDDATLVARAREGEAWAEDAIVRRYYAPIAGTVARLLGDRDEALDVVQDTFETLLVELADLRDPAALRGWLMQIAVRKVHRRFRRRSLLRALGFGADEEGLATLASEDGGPEARAELALLDRALAELPAAERIAWTLRRVEGLQLEEVARSCGCSLATAKRRIGAAEERVRARVAIDFPEEAR